MIKLILFGILKGIGILLLVLLLLLLLMVLVVLLSPIRYHLEGEKRAAVSGSFGVSWLFGAIRADGGYTPEGGSRLKLRVLWFTPVGGEEKPKKKKKKKKRKEPEPIEIHAAEKESKEEPEPAEPKPEPKKEQPKQEPKKQEPKKQAKPQRMAEKQPKTMRRVKLSEIAEKPPAPPRLSDCGAYTTRLSLPDWSAMVLPHCAVTASRKSSTMPWVASLCSLSTTMIRHGATVSFSMDSNRVASSC